jgi:hypothetical protein
VSVRSDVAVIFRFLGWLKGFIHDRNHSTENLVRGYGRVTVIRRAPSRIRTAIVQRYASNQLVLPKSSFLALPDNRMQRRSRAGRHEVQVRLSRRNHKVMVSIHQEEPRLEKLLKAEFGDLHTTARAIRFTTSAGVKCDGFPVAKGVWFGFDPHDSSRTKVGRVVDVFACTFDTNFTEYQCFLKIEVFKDASLYNFTDYTVNLARPGSVMYIPLKTICSTFWIVPHWDVNVFPPLSCLLLIKHL